AAESVAVGDPRLVDRVVPLGHDALHAPAQHVRVDVRADRIVRRDERLRAHLPRPRAVTVRLVVQRADRAEIDDVSGELVLDRALDVRADHGPLAAPDRAELLDTLDLDAETHAPSAMDTARHVGRDQPTDVEVIHDALSLRLALHLPAESHGD